MRAATNEEDLIPPPAAVRVELARSVRRSRRLRALLRLAALADEDRLYLESLGRESTGDPRQAMRPEAALG